MDPLPLAFVLVPCGWLGANVVVKELNSETMFCWYVGLSAPTPM
jgi:hypothetical protein